MEQQNQSAEASLIYASVREYEDALFGNESVLGFTDLCGTDWYIINLRDLNVLKKIRYMGCAYILQWGSLVKIGQSSDLLRRIKTLSCAAKNYHDSACDYVAFTSLHSNPRKTEKALHAHFMDSRVNNSELFRLEFFASLNMLPGVDLEDDDVSISLDRAQKLVRLGESLLGSHMDCEEVEGMRLT